MFLLQDLAVAEIHVDAARQTRIEAAHRAHDVDALEVVRTVLLEDRRVLHRVFVGSRRAVDIARIRVPRRRRIRMIVRDLAVADDHVMRQDAAHRFVETAADRFVRNFEWCEGRGASGVHFLHCLFEEVERAAGGVSLEVGAGAIAFDRVAPFRNFPFELDFALSAVFGRRILTL